MPRNGGRAGASGGPRALRRAWSPLAFPAARGTPLYDAGDIACREHDLEGAQRALGARVEALQMPLTPERVWRALVSGAMA